MEKDVEVIKKEICFLCYKELPYREYLITTRNWNAQPTGIKRKTVLIKDKCSELEIILATNGNHKLISAPQYKHVHKDCADQLLGRNHEIKKGFVLLGESQSIGSHGHLYIFDDAYLKLRRKK